MPEFQYSFSYESDQKPVHTVKGKVVSKGPKSAMKSALRKALAEWPKHQRYRSWVLVVEGE